MEAEVRHRRDGDALDAQVEPEPREDLVAVDRLSALVDREHPVAVAVEGDAEIEAAGANGVRQQGEVGRAAADVDVRPIRLVADRDDLGAELLERLRREACVGAVRAVDPDAEAAEVSAEPLEHVLEVAVRGHLDPVDLAAAGYRAVEEHLDLLLGGVRQLAAVAVEELDAVEFRRIVRGGDDRSEIETEQRDSGRRQDTGQHGASAGGSYPVGEGLL